MPRDSSGNFSNVYNWEQDAANGIGIEPDRHQEGDDDQAQGLTDSLDRKGRGGMQADLAMGNFKISQLNEGSAATDGLNIGQAQTEKYQTSSTETGTANTYVISLSPAPTSYSEGLTVKFVATNANTGASTLQVGGLTPAPALQWQSKDLVANTITAGMVVEALYDGIAFQILSPPEVLPSAYGGTGSTNALGTAAFEDVGTAIGNVPQFEDVGGNPVYPANSGEQITNVDPDIDGRTEETDIDPAADFLIFYDTSAGANRKIKPEDLGTTTGVFHANEEQPPATNGGTFTAGSWVKRGLNTIVTNTITGASMTSSVVTLPAGTYDLDFAGIGYRVGNHMTRVRDTSNTATVGLGVAQNSQSGGESNSSHGRGRIVAAGTVTIELQHRGSVTQSNTGLGSPTNFDENNVYSYLKITQVG